MLLVRTRYGSRGYHLAVNWLTGDLEIFGLPIQLSFEAGGDNALEIILPSFLSDLGGEAL